MTVTKIEHPVAFSPDLSAPKKWEALWKRIQDQPAPINTEHQHYAEIDIEEYYGSLLVETTPEMVRLAERVIVVRDHTPKTLQAYYVEAFTLYMRNGNQKHLEARLKPLKELGWEVHSVAPDNG